jgi:ATP-binding cassette, subfamily B (MDR/TAP), member 6
MFITLASYIPLTIYLTERRGKYRKDLNAADNVRSARATDALISWETVSYFCAQDREVERLAGAIDDYQTVEMKLLASLNSLNVIQSTVIFLGTASGL